MIRCPRKFCGLLMEPQTDGMGRVLFVCRGCARNKQGRCRDCPRRLSDPRALRCTICARERYLELARQRDRARYATRRDQVLAAHKARQAIPEIREHRRRYMMAYRASHPRDGLDRAYMRAYQQKRRADPAYRARENAQKRAARARKREQRRAA